MPDKILSQIDQDTFLITTYNNEKKALEQAMFEYANKSNFHSTYFNENAGNVTNFKIEDIDRLALNAQTNLSNIIQINNIVRYFVNKNDILGKVYEAIETNVNSEWTIAHPKYTEEEKEIVEFVDKLIRDFNEKINIERLIIEAIPMTYLEGNYAIYLRKDIDRNNYQVDFYPLGICEVADYEVNGEPYVLINIKELESRLRKIYSKNRKNKALFYANMDEEIRDTYPEEVYKAFKNKEQYAVLKIENSGLIRINNLKRKYGLSPIFKALKSVVRLENIELSDDKNTLVRGKKIIFQKLVKELITQSKDMPNITWSSAQAKAHTDLMQALSANGVSVYTGLPWTEKIEFIEPKLEQTNVQIKRSFREEIMTSVGIAYLSADKGSFGSAKINLTELMKVINRIGSQLERILQKWYKGLLIDHGIDEKFTPKIKVIDSELLEQELKVSLATFVFDKLGASYKTTFEILGKDYETEYMRRKKENDENADLIFYPRVNAYTVADSENNHSGRPESNKDKSRQEYDSLYNKENER
ncbi:hypothetical protein [Paenibacillus naphthalenovorans]|uniref:Phage portal protein n=1 Tax=Paenibacillus naphthalenovorans TaxID=162209 RepID=A0A0U2IM97_9BACL|nr:hypothetical protein [Paenibacillus naphthalenovorans]ALS22299.1 hypothetical protein IJ22_19250 [Paenibacillus naphthalenovorans]